MPTKADFITQIKADLETPEGESEEVLRERLARVEAAPDDAEGGGHNAAAAEAYHGHLAELREAEAAPAEPQDAA